MPIYEYACDRCHHEFEKLVLGKEGDVRCPTCRSGKVKKLMSAAAFKSSDGQFVSGSGSGGCAGCSSGSCSTCG